MAKLSKTIRYRGKTIKVWDDSIYESFGTSPPAQFKTLKGAKQFILDHEEKISPIEVPDGCKSLMHFFIQDQNQPDTRIEMRVFVALKDLDLANVYKIKEGTIIQAQSHSQDNYLDIHWAFQEKDSGTFWLWLNRILVNNRDQYEIWNYEPEPDMK